MFFAGAFFNGGFFGLLQRGGSSKGGKRPRYWWEKEEPKEVQLPYVEPETVMEVTPFRATPEVDISGELAELDEKIAGERRAKRKKRTRRVALLAMMLDD